MNMKKLLIVILTIALVFALITCEKDDDDPDPCNCLSTYGTTAHLGMNETCTCGGTGCECTEQTATVGGITVRKQAGVTVQQMNTAVAIIQNAYTSNTNNLSGKITAIHVTISGKDWVYDASKIVQIKLSKVNEANYVINLFDLIRDDEVTPGSESNE